MNKHIVNGNKILGTAKRMRPAVSIGSVSKVKTHFYGDEETVAKAKKEYLLALNDHLSKTEKRVVENRLYELSRGLVNLWISEHYAEKQSANISVPERRKALTQKVKMSANTSPEQLPAVEKLIDEMSRYITNTEWIDADETYPQEPTLVIMFHKHPEKATEFVEKLPHGLETYCRADTGYVRIDFQAKETSAVEKENAEHDELIAFAPSMNSQDELVNTALSFWYLFNRSYRSATK